MDVEWRNGERLIDLRDLLGLPQTSLSERLGVKQSFISMVESGSRPLPESLAADAVAAFSLPVSFFTVPTMIGDALPVTFRKASGASIRDERRVIKEFREAARLFALVSDATGYRTSRLPDPRDFGGDAELLAEEVRRLGGLGVDEPVPNVTRLLEKLGVGVLSYLEPGQADVSDHISVSRPADATGRPLIALIGACSGEVGRLSIAHELGHLFFDRSRAKPISNDRSIEEKRADTFASYLLVPGTVMRQQISESLTLHGYLPVKAKYGVSVAALIARAQQMGLISGDRARSLRIQRSSQGWNRQEPVSVKTEKSMLFEQCYSRVFPSKSNLDVTETTGIMVSLLDTWFPAKAMPSTVVSLADWRARRNRPPIRASYDDAV